MSSLSYEVVVVHLPDTIVHMVKSNTSDLKEGLKGTHEHIVI